MPNATRGQIRHLRRRIRGTSALARAIATTVEMMRDRFKHLRDPIDMLQRPGKMFGAFVAQFQTMPNPL
jgi:hypothetical protein